MREKVKGQEHQIEVEYSQMHWKILNEKRQKAISIMKIISLYNPIVHGSLARGDVTKKSDIDIVLLYQVPSFLIEMSLQQNNISIQNRHLIQATPKHVIKGQITIDEETTISIPLVKLTNLELEFYKFGGLLDLKGLVKNHRVPGIDKRLVLIIPTPKGHIEKSILGNIKEASKIVGVSSAIISERIKILKRRDEIGRTGIYLKYELAPDENFESALDKLIKRDPALRRMLKTRGLDL